MTEPTSNWRDRMEPSIPVRVEDIIVGKRLRPLNAERVAELERSIAALGLWTPITIRHVNGLGSKPTLVAGAHRLQAVKNLGWDEIPVQVFKGDDRAARMWEIAENLHRAELTALERSEQLAEWVRLAEDANVQSAQVDPIGSKREDGRGHRPESGINQASRELNIERKAAQRAVKIDGLTPEAKAAAVEFGLDNNQSALLEAAKAKSVGEQVAALQARREQRQAARLQATMELSEDHAHLIPLMNELKKVKRHLDRSFISAWVEEVWFSGRTFRGLYHLRDFKTALGQFATWYAGLIADEQLQVDRVMGEIEAVQRTPERAEPDLETHDAAAA